MPRFQVSVEKIRAELAWVIEPVDPNVCGCRHLPCCEQTGHAVGKCHRNPTEKTWSFRQEYRISAQSGGSYYFARDQRETL
jgi:hypothetical protein